MSAGLQNLAHFVRTHEKALANALQPRRQGNKSGQSGQQTIDVSQKPLVVPQSSEANSSISSALVAALSLGTLGFASQNVKAAKLALTSHHLFYLLSRFEEIGITVGPLNVRTENLHSEASPANYVSFLGQSQRLRGRSDGDSIRSVSSVRSVMSGMAALWSGFGSSNSVAKTEKAQGQLVLDLKYLFSSFTKVPCLRLAPDRRARLIRGYEEFPFDTAVPLLAFKNLSALELCDVDFRQFFGWDKLAEQLRSLTLKRAHVDDINDVLTSIVLDDMDKHRRRSSKAQSSPVLAWPLSPPVPVFEAVKLSSTLSSPAAEHNVQPSKSGQIDRMPPARSASASPNRPTSSRHNAAIRHVRSNSRKVKRSGSGSSDSSVHSTSPRVGTRWAASSSNLLLAGTLPSSKWRFLRHLSLADNALTSISARGLAPLANSLHSLDLSSNLFTEVPDGLANLIVLRALNLSNCMIGSLQSLIRGPLPAINALNLRANRLTSIIGVEKLLSLERLDLRENKIGDPAELARLTGLPDFREVWIMQNPFTQSHTNHRVVIFNLFRRTPGLVNDISIDASGPAYNERQQLIDRVVETEPVSVVRKVQQGTQADPYTTDGDQNTSTAQHRTDTDDCGQDPHSLHQALKDQRPSVPAANARSRSFSQTATKYRSSRKGIRRPRLVDLAATEDKIQDISPVSQQTSAVRELVVPPGNLLALSSLAGNDASSVPPEIQHPASPSDGVATSSVGAPSSSSSDKIEGLLSSDIRHTKLQAQAYRQKIVAFKQEVGSNWLSALSDEGWVRDKKADRVNADACAMPSVRPEVSLLSHT
ncbi:MAG: hypothetical protein LQ346_008137 [Caloplaca aetnensis]|nr:MAG: hypothetical protein LQ346_008137 [Caloplaca aetnensis]